jgi:AcrR family transcriptional regulator
VTNTRSSKTQPYHHGDLRRALVHAALAIVTDEQDWTFSLREAARRAGVSHAAPYNHFVDKNDLLSAVAALGFERLRDGMRAAINGAEDPVAELMASGRAYVRLGMKNPALYRLMFGPALASPETGERPTLARSAGAEAREVLKGIILRGAQSGAFAVAASDKRDLLAATLSAWSMVHGLTLLIIDTLQGEKLPMRGMIERVLEIHIEGLRPRAKG